VFREIVPSAVADHNSYRTRIKSGHTDADAFIRNDRE
jgi:hypothetical protein